MIYVNLCSSAFVLSDREIKMPDPACTYVVYQLCLDDCISHLLMAASKQQRPAPMGKLVKSCCKKRDDQTMTRGQEGRGRSREEARKRMTDRQEAWTPGEPETGRDTRWKRSVEKHQHEQGRRIKIATAEAAAAARLREQGAKGLGCCSCQL